MQHPPIARSFRVPDVTKIQAVVQGDLSVHSNNILIRGIPQMHKGLKIVDAMKNFFNKT